MAVDTARKRISAVNTCMPFTKNCSIPDGAVDQPDRQSITWCYSGITASAPVVSVTIDRHLADIMQERLETALGESGQLDDLWYWYLEDQTSKVGHINDLHFYWLGTLGHTQFSLQDRMISYLESLGYSGELDDMFYDAWNNGDYI